VSQESFRTTITVLQGEIAKLQEKIKSHKQTINHLCGVMSEPPLYQDADDEISAGASATRSDEFYGIALATAVRTILERRKRSNLGAATVPEIFKVMKDGGFHFEAKNDANAQRSLHIALSKNTTTFHRLPNSNKYGLREWYSSIKERAKSGPSAEDSLPIEDFDTLPTDEVQAEAKASEAETANEGTLIVVEDRPRQRAKAR
jgi:hypothetical protein